jgi:SAM-dependent methyltransferase
MNLAPFVVCPETLGPLERADGGVWSPKAERLYPIERGLVFMGYPQRDHEMIDTTMAEEREHQGVGEEVAERNLEFLRFAAPRAVDFINVVERFVVENGRRPRALELGSGNGWVSWLLAEAGFDTWMCDFEANTLVTGLGLEHPNLGEGKRFVTDARYAPFATGSMDLVVFKEFVHHVADYKGLFREANRVLRVGGTVAMMEPLRTVMRTVREARHPQTREGHHFEWPGAYLRALRNAGFAIAHEEPMYGEGGNTRRPTAWLKKRAMAAIDEQHPAGDWVSKLQLRTFGGASLVIAGWKARDLPVAPRPAMAVIDPASALQVEEPPAAYAQFPAILRESAEKLDRLPG